MIGCEARPRFPPDHTVCGDRRSCARCRQTSHCSSEAIYGRLADADVSGHEPLEASSPLLTMDQVVLSPHSLCWTDGFAQAVVDSAIQAIIDVAEGRMARHQVDC